MRVRRVSSLMDGVIFFSIVDNVAFETTLAEGVDLEKQLSRTTFGLVGRPVGERRYAEGLV